MSLYLQCYNSDDSSNLFSMSVPWKHEGSLMLAEAEHWSHTCTDWFASAVHIMLHTDWLIHSYVVSNIQLHASKLRPYIHDLKS